MLKILIFSKKEEKKTEEIIFNFTKMIFFCIFQIQMSGEIRIWIISLNNRLLSKKCLKVCEDFLLISRKCLVRHC